MQRYVYMAQCKVNQEEAAVSQLKGRKAGLESLQLKDEIMTLSLFQWNGKIFLYYECVDRSISPAELFGDVSGVFLEWPGESEVRYWVPMMDIYHCCVPLDKDYWKRKQPVKRAFAAVNRLKPEMVSSYIFYHFQYQEEKPGDWAKYASIYLQENLMFFYREDPDGRDVPDYKGLLDTDNTPSPWQPLMNTHFIAWEDDPEYEKPWREIEQILYV